MLETFDSLSLDDQISYAEFQLQCAISHLDDLMRQKAELDAEIEAQYQAHVDNEFGRLSLESDNHDCRVREVYDA